ncbi:MAG TPA: SDR family NAD(P)-dependent oxidoreductase [Xanthobacteraceae bacterium]|nr:SDR family NAD(P)-dependent oxidoreductase [Xanthobacteraceae bacterium]
MTSGPAASGVAIIGMACRFPGAVDHRAYWRNLCEGVESITPLAEAELVAAGVPAAALRDPTYVKAAPLLSDVDVFDAEFFEYSPHEARVMDPQQRLLLEVAWSAFEDAGRRPDSAAPVGVFVGTGGVVSSYLIDRLASSADLPGQTGSLAHIGNDKDFASTRISYKLNLTGPSINVQTACSTSLVAVHLACQAILAGECDMALAGAATVRVPQRVGYVSVKGGILSPDGHCRAFDAAAEGTIFGSGVGAVLLKDAAAALADGDHIYAVIRGSAINNDGAEKVSYTASSVAGQARAMVEAMSVAEISADRIGYVECHGTGTIVGDPLEIDALTRAFRTATDRRGFCAIGSVKTNIGHLEQTAGIAALIKAALALEHGRIPPSLNFRTPNPKIDFTSSPFFVNTQCRDWPADGHPRVAAVNSLGLGGTNAFVVLEEPPAPESAAPAVVPASHLFVLSARSEPALRRSIASHRAALTDVAAPLADICFTLAAGRTHLAHRFFAVASSPAELRDALAEPAISLDGAPQEVPARRIAFLFSGQASQYAGMGAELYRSEPEFRHVIDRCEETLRGDLERPLTQVLFGAEGDDGAIDQTAYTQPALFAVQAALVALWRSWGITPDLVLGHSVGELAAAYCAGVYSLEEALTLTANRARIMQALPPGGAMTAIFADEAAVATALQDFDRSTLGLAAVNAPHNTVVSGARASVDAALRHFTALGIQARLLTVSHAFHSPLMNPAMDAFSRVAARANGRKPQLDWVSTVTGALMSGPPDAHYWCEHALNAVRFMDGLATLRAMGATDFVEIGPGNTLLALGRQCDGGAGLAWLGSLDKRGDTRQMLASLGALYRRGSAVDWDGFNRSRGGRRVSLPAYPFERRRFWIDGEATNRSGPSPAAGRSLTGTRVRSPLSDVQFESAYGLAQFGYLTDHRIYGMPVLPFTAGLVALQQAARDHFRTDAVEIDNLQYREAMVLPETGERIVQSVLAPTDTDTADCRLASIGGEEADAWRTHMLGMVRPTSAPPYAPLGLEDVGARCTTVIPRDRYYAALQRLGLEYGPAFRGIESLRRGGNEVIARVRLPDGVAIEDAPSLHPALLDACLHVYPALVDAYGDLTAPPPETRRTFLPISMERFRSAGPGVREVWVHAVRRDASAEGLTLDIAIYRDDGSFAAEMTGLSLKPLSPQELSQRAKPQRVDWLYRMEWQERPGLTAPAAAAGEPAAWVVLADRSGVGRALADLLERRGDTCHVIPRDALAEAPVADARGETDHVIERLSIELAALMGSGAVRGVIDLWALDVATECATPDGLETSQKITVGAAAAVFRTAAQAPGGAHAAPKIWLVTRNAIMVRPQDRAAEPARASLWGLGRSAALEHPQLWGGLLDLDAAPDASSAADAAALLGEITHGDGEDQVALRAGHRFGARLVRAAPPVGGDGRFDPEAIYVVTGGLGALGIKLAQWLVDRHGVKRIALISRRGPADPLAEPTRLSFAALGVQLTIVKADVTDAAELREALGALRQSPQPIKGIFHCAGLLDDGILMQMDWPKFHRVMAPKVEGAWLLHTLTRDLALDHFVVFSSILSLIGSAGQANYAAANAFLDALVQRRRSEGLPALALNFGPWDESGLATASGDKGRVIWRARGTEYIDGETGNQALDLLTGSDLAHGAISITQWPVFIQQFAAVPPLYRELQKETAAAPAASHAEGLRAKLGAAAPSERRALLIAFIAQQAAKTLGMSDPVPAERPLRELGLDSLMSVTLVNRMETALGIRISAAKLIPGPSVEQLVDDLMPLLATEGEPAARPAPAATAEAEPANADSGRRWLVVVGPRAAPRFRLFCFPFAGGGSAVYRSWAQALDPGIEVVAIEPPGRLSRIAEPPVSDMTEFVDQLAEEMTGALDRPFAFFGHCLGALTMYETARRLIHTTPFRPVHLFASGARPPDRIADQSSFEERLTNDLLNLAEFRISLPAHRQPDDVFAELIRHFNIQATEQLLVDPELRGLMLPVIRAEFEMASNYHFAGEQPWDIPITCFAARGDPYVSRRHALGWGRFTNARLQVFIRDGAHFAVVDDVGFIHTVINRELH